MVKTNLLFIQRRVVTNIQSQKNQWEALTFFAAFLGPAEGA